MFFGLSRVINRLMTDHSIQELNNTNQALTRHLAECEQEFDRLNSLMAIEVYLFDKAQSDLRQLISRFSISEVSQRWGSDIT